METPERNTGLPPHAGTETEQRRTELLGWCVRNFGVSCSKYGTGEDSGRAR